MDSAKFVAFKMYVSTVCVFQRDIGVGHDEEHLDFGGFCSSGLVLLISVVSEKFSIKRIFSHNKCEMKSCVTSLHSVHSFTEVFSLADRIYQTSCVNIGWDQILIS